MAVLFTNNAASRLAVAITAGATTLSVTSGEGSKFPSPSGGDWFPLTLVKASGALEILQCTGRSGDVLTVVRAQEGTSAQAFSAGDRAELRLTSAAIQGLFGGSAISPKFASIELSASSPFIDFHYNNSAADYTVRLIATSPTAVAFANAALGTLLTIDSAAITAKPDLVSEGKVLAGGGIAEVGTAGAGSIQIRYDGALAVRAAGGGYGAFGKIWTENNFNPSGKVNGESTITGAGFAGDDVNAPFFRRTSDGVVYYLQRQLGYTPVQQGGASGMLANKLYMGWNGARLIAQVDTTAMGALCTVNNLNGDLAAITVGQVGGYAFMRNMTGAAIEAGGSASGAQLIYSSTNPANGSQPAIGTWRCHGSVGAGQCTLFQRTS